MTDEMNIQPEPSKGRVSRKTVAAAVAVGVLGGTAAGLVFGVPGLSSASSNTGSLSAAVAQATDPATTDPATTSGGSATPATPATPGTADSTRPDPSTHLREELQPLVDAGTITAAQADAVVAQLVKDHPGGGEGFGGPGGRGGHGGPGHFIENMSDAVTKALGIDAATLRQQLESGSSLATIAKSKNVDPQVVIDALVAEATTNIDQAVTDGKIDAAKATEIKSNLTERITAMVNGERPAHDGMPDSDGPSGDQAPPTTAN